VLAAPLQDTNGEFSAVVLARDLNERYRWLDLAGRCVNRLPLLQTSGITRLYRTQRAFGGPISGCTLQRSAGWSVEQSLGRSLGQWTDEMCRASGNLSEAWRWTILVPSGDQSAP
jgi:hypothetical protein